MASATEWVSNLNTSEAIVLAAVIIAIVILIKW